MTEPQQQHQPTVEEREPDQQHQQPITEEPQQQHQEEQKEHVQEPPKYEDPVAKRIRAYRAALEPMEGTTKVNLDLIRKLAFDGIPDQAGLRGIYWKLLLDYLPPDKTLWEETLKERRKSYYELKSFFIINPAAEDTDDSCDHVNTIIQEHYPQLFASLFNFINNYILIWNYINR